MDCVHQFLVQVRIWVLPGVAYNLAAAYQFRYCCHSNLVIYNRVSFKFHIWIASIKFWFKYEYGFGRQTIAKMAYNMAAAYHLRCCGHSNLVNLIGFLSNFIYGLLPSNTGSVRTRFCPTNDNQDCRQNGRHLSVCFCGHYLTLLQLELINRSDLIRFS